MDKNIKKTFIVGLSSTFILSSMIPAIASEKNISDKLVNKYHYGATLVDTHIDTIMGAIDRNTYLPSNPMTNTDSNVSVKKMVKGGLDVACWGAYTGGKMNEDNSSVDFRYANNSLLSSINALYYVDNQNKKLEIATSTKDIYKLVKSGKVVAIPQIEGAYSFNKDNAIELLKQYYDLGIRVLSLTHSNSSAICEGFNEHFADKTPSSGGLSDTGEDVINEMNKLGMVVDVSHLSEKSIDEILNKSKAPIIASHTGVQSIVKTGRNLTDKQLRKLAKNGGVAQVTFYTGIINDDYKNVTSKEVCDVIDYIVDKIGIDHVGIGTDFDGAPMPLDLKDATQLPNLTKELIKRGYDKYEISKILGGNTLRVIKDVEESSQNKNTGKFLDIKPSVEMSEQISSNTKSFSAKIHNKDGYKLKTGTEKVILDGEEVNCKYNQFTKNITIKLDRKLDPYFHVITFSAKTTNGKESRETVLFYVNK